MNYEIIFLGNCIRDPFIKISYINNCNSKEEALKEFIKRNNDKDFFKKENKNEMEYSFDDLIEEIELNFDLKVICIINSNSQFEEEYSWINPN